MGPLPLNLRMDPGNMTIDELIRSVDRGVYITRFHYVNVEEPLPVTLTGMTRDGTFRIENGEITQPLVEMRWNESVLRLLNHIVASGAPVATGGFFPMAMPALLARDCRSARTSAA